MTAHFHAKLIEFSKLLNIDTIGVCRGYIFKRIEAYLLKEQSEFNALIKKIIKSEHNTSNLEKSIIKHRGNETLSEEEYDLLEAYIFYIQMSMYLRPDLYFVPALSPFDILQISKKASPRLTEQDGGLTSIYSEIGTYTREEISNILNQFNYALNHLLSLKEPTMGFVFSNNNHTLALRNIGDQTWQFIDINDDESVLDDKVLVTEQAANSIYDGLTLYTETTVVNDLIELLNQEEERWLTKKNWFTDVYRTKILCNQHKFDLTYIQGTSTWLFSNETSVLDKLTPLWSNKKTVSQRIFNQAYANEHWNKYISMVIEVVTTVRLEDQFALGLQFKKHLMPQLVTQEIIDREDINNFAYLAVLTHNFDSIKILIENHVDLNKVRCFDDETLMHLTALFNYIDIMSLLLETNLDINAQSDQKRTPIWYAAEKCHVSMLTMLIENGADVTLPDNTGKKPIDIAKHSNCSSLIIDKLNATTMCMKHHEKNQYISNYSQGLFHPKRESPSSLSILCFSSWMLIFCLAAYLNKFSISKRLLLLTFFILINESDASNLKQSSAFSLS